MSPKVGGLLSWSVQLDSPETALTVGGWIRPRGQNYWGRKAAILTHPPSEAAVFNYRSFNWLQYIRREQCDVQSFVPFGFSQIVIE